MTLKVHISSFSYKQGLPVDTTGHGGGFIFDCRSIENPGRKPELKLKTGRSPEVINFLSQRDDASKFFAHVEGLSTSAISNYLSRGHESISFAFGCTGGQHRSVYMAERLAARLRQEQGVTVELSHREFAKHPEWENKG